MSNVLLLPTAAAEPVINPRWRGRYPSVVTRLRPNIEAGVTVIVVTGSNKGKYAEVLNIELDRVTGELDVHLRSLGEPFEGLFYTDTKKEAEPHPIAWFSMEWVRRAIVPHHQSASYVLPAWPKRWEENIARMEQRGAA